MPEKKEAGQGKEYTMALHTILLKPVSGLCNMSCDYCFYCDEMKKRDIPSYGMMSEETLEKLSVAFGISISELVESLGEMKDDPVRRQLREVLEDCVQKIEAVYGK